VWPAKADAQPAAGPDIRRNALAKADRRTRLRRIKAWLGSTHFLMKRLPKTKIALHILTFSLKRVIVFPGAGPEIRPVPATGLARAERSRPA
jgi:hypothetical protein